MRRKGWWEQMQSGEYPETKLKYGDSSWATFKALHPKPSINTNSQSLVQSQGNCPSCGELYWLDKGKCSNCGWAEGKYQGKPFSKDKVDEPQATISKIRNILDEVYAEEQLYESLSHCLKYLREIYRRNKLLFSDEDIVFLQKTNEINKSVASFIELRDEFVQIKSLEHYHELLAVLVLLRDCFDGLAIKIRVEKEIRGLFEKRGITERLEEKKYETELNNKINKLERNAPNCPQGHKMVIREGKYSLFWGCSKFPACSATKGLNMEDKKFLSE